MNNGVTKIDVHMEDETICLSKAQMAELFQTTKQNVSLHISNCFKEGELDKNPVASIRNPPHALKSAIILGVVSGKINFDPKNNKKKIIN